MIVEGVYSLMKWSHARKSHGTKKYWGTGIGVLRLHNHDSKWSSLSFCHLQCLVRDFSCMCHTIPNSTHKLTSINLVSGSTLGFSTLSWEMIRLMRLGILGVPHAKLHVQSWCSDCKFQNPHIMTTTMTMMTIMTTTMVMLMTIMLFMLMHVGLHTI